MSFVYFILISELCSSSYAMQHMIKKIDDHHSNLKKSITKEDHSNASKLSSLNQTAFLINKRLMALKTDNDVNRLSKSIKDIKFTTTVATAAVAIDNEFPIIVTNDVNFKRQIVDSLNLLKLKAPDALKLIRKYVKRIEQSSTTGMCAYCNPPTFQLTNKPDNLELYWLSGIIAHDAYHSYLYHYNKQMLQQQHNLDNNLNNNNNEPDPDTWTGFKAEQQCNNYQYKVLKQINAPPNLINYVESLDGTHCDLNGDGVCDEKDYNLRNYK